MEFFFNLLHTSLFLQICFLYVPITQEIIDKMSSPQNKKCGPWKIFGIKPPSNPATLWAGEALNAQIQGCLNITLAQKWYFVIFQISAEKSFLAWQKSFCIFLYKFVGCNLQKQCGKTSRFIKWEQGFLSSSLETIFCRNLKNDKCHFWVDAIFRQPCIWASKTSPAQKL